MSKTALLEEIKELESMTLAQYQRSCMLESALIIIHRELSDRIVNTSSLDNCGMELKLAEIIDSLVIHENDKHHKTCISRLDNL